MARMLGIDTVGPDCSVALFEGGDLIAHRHERIGRGHAERLVPMIAELPGRGRANLILVDVGPGSFTGVRVGLAAARALAFAWGAELMGYSSLALIAARAQSERGQAPVAVATTGGHGEWFVESFDAAGEGDGTRSLPPEAAAAEIGAALVAGDRAPELVARRGFGEALTLGPDARALPLLGGRALAPARALYGRAPDARIPGA